MELPLVDFEYEIPVSLNAVVSLSTFQQESTGPLKELSSESEDSADDLLFRVHALQITTEQKYLLPRR